MGRKERMASSRSEVSFSAKRRARMTQADARNGSTEERKAIQIDPIVYENSAFEAYYKAQDIVFPEEWGDFMEFQRQHLPAAVRVNVGAPLWRCTRSFFQLLSKNDPEGLKCLQFVPHNLACKCAHIYQHGQWEKVSKITMKKTSGLESLHQVLMNQDFRYNIPYVHTQGSITRQEAVSMLPCLLMDIKASHLVLDMCASPGSKTSQLLDMMQWSDRVDDDKNVDLIGVKPPSGAVIANDLNQSRAQTLSHQIQRLATPCAGVACLDASHFPANIAKYRHSNIPLRFDRILGIEFYSIYTLFGGSVSCGDGTLRKNADVWKTWTTNGGLSLHAMQIAILMRGLLLLKNDGLLVYSTCSLNPIEDEAVVAFALGAQKGRIELVEPPELQGLKLMRGKNFWFVPAPPEKQKRKGNTEATEKTASMDESEGKTTVPSCEGQSSNVNNDKNHVDASTTVKLFKSFDEVPENLKDRIRPSMFPPEDVSSMNLDRCIRILPHQNNTGGFFMCCFRKIQELDHTRMHSSNKAAHRQRVDEAKKNVETIGTEVATLSRSLKIKEENGNDCSHMHQHGFKTKDNRQVHDSNHVLNDQVSYKNGMVTGIDLAVGDGGLTAADNPLFDDDSMVSNAVNNGNKALCSADTPALGCNNLYDLAVASTRSGGLFQLLIPLKSDIESRRDIEIICEFYGMTDGTLQLCKEDIRHPNTISCLPLDQLFRRAHTKRKIFFLSYRLSALVRGEDSTMCDESGRSKNSEMDKSEYAEAYLKRLIDSKLQWMHAGVKLFILHQEESEDGCIVGGMGWRIPQEAVSMALPYMRRRVLFLSLFASRGLLLSSNKMLTAQQIKQLQNRKHIQNIESCFHQGMLQPGGVVCVICPQSVLNSEEISSDCSSVLKPLVSLNNQYPALDTPFFKAMRDCFCISGWISSARSLFAFIHKKEARGVCEHLFKITDVIN